MMTMYAPGPWKLCYDGEIESADGCTVVSLSFDSYKEFNESSEVVKANYRLIAAAPDLLAALVAISEFIPITSASEGGASAYSANVVAADMVRAAIAKATE